MVQGQKLVRVGMDLAAGAFGNVNNGIGGRCHLACGVRYDRKQRGLYLTNTYLEHLDVKGVPAYWTNMLREVVNVIGTQYIEKHPVYTLPDAFAYRLLKSVKVEPAGVRLTFGV